MADLDLRTDYKDDILDSSVNEKRIYNLVDSDGNIVAENISLVDNSVYTQKGDSFGAADINKTNQAVLKLNQSLAIVYTETVNDIVTVVYPNGFSFENCYIATCEVNVTADTYQSFYADASGIVPMVQAIQTNTGATLVIRSDEAKGKIIRVIFRRF